MLEPAEADRNFEQVVDQFYEPMYSFAMSLTRDQNDASDLTQDLFVRWAERGHQVREPSMLKSWLCTTMRRMFIRHRRKHARMQSNAATPLIMMNLEEPSPAPDAAMGASEMVTALQNLEEPFRTPLILYYLRQHTYQEISDTLQIPMGTVMSRLTRGRRRLRETLGVV